MYTCMQAYLTYSAPRPAPENKAVVAEPVAIKHISVL